jgi:hypothetical protein
MRSLGRGGAVRAARLAVVFGGAAASLAGCGTNPEPTTVVCTDFRAGADLSASTFGVTGDLQRPYGAFAQAAGDLAAVANGMLRDVGAACRGLALELGADGDDPRAAGQAEPETVRAWCNIAAERVTKVRPQLARVHFAVQVVTPRCTLDTTFQVACEGKCSADASCVEAAPEERCPEAARAGVCGATCTGTCTGSETAPATCEGACGGMCFGTCEVRGSAGASTSETVEAVAAPEGAGGAVDCSTGCVCTGTCRGACTAGCDLPSGGGACDATCSGACSEPMRGQGCLEALAPPRCAGDVDCQKSCTASSAARAVCPDGSLAVIVDESARGDRAVTQIVSALDRNLPAIFLAARGRAKVLADGASDLLDSAGHILNRTEELGPMGAACGMLIGQTGSEARKNLNAALGGSKAVANAVMGSEGSEVEAEPDEDADAD